MQAALAASPVSHAVRPSQACSRAFAASPVPLRPCHVIAKRSEPAQRPQGAAQLQRRRCCALVCAASAAAVPTAAPGATKIGFLGIGIMGNAMVGCGCCCQTEPSCLPCHRLLSARFCPTAACLARVPPVFAAPASGRQPDQGGLRGHGVEPLRRQVRGAAGGGRQGATGSLNRARAAAGGSLC